jgi:UDP-glucose 4-epimerase
MSVLVTGGAGYIGSHVCRLLLENHEDVIAVDNLQTGHRKAVTTSHFYPCDIRDKEAMSSIFQKHSIDTVIHFAANSLVAESMQKPFEYYHNNVYGMLRLLEVMKENHVQTIVFSSTAATYGEPVRIPIEEEDPTVPTNTYGETKLAMEKMMKWFQEAYGISYVSLRYFNASGAITDGSIGEDHTPETHLIPLVLQVPLGKRESISIFGDNYPTPDGTCIRDYIHVMDLASAHYKALEYLRAGNDSDIFNLGNGNGYSVKEVIDVTRSVTGHSIPAVVRDRRSGDPAVLVASSTKAQLQLGWKPEFGSLEKIVTDAWNWHKKNPEGYGE